MTTNLLDAASYVDSQQRKRTRLEGTLATISICLVLAVLPAIFFWKFIIGGDVLYWGTPMLQFYPWRQLAVDMYLSGQAPLWNQYLGAGAPLAANLQSAVFYPLNVIFLLLPVEHAMGYSLALHVALAGLFSFFLSRTLGFSRLGSVVAALSFMFSGFVISRGHFLSMTSVVAWLPLLMAAAERLVSGVEEGNRLTHWKTCFSLALMVAAVSMSLLAGHAQLAYYGFLFVLFYSVYRVSFGSRVGGVILDRERIVNAVSAGYRILIGTGLGVGVAAVQLLITLELALNSIRSTGADYDFAMTLSLYPWQLVGLVAPDVFGNPATGNYWGPGGFWETDGYVGVLPLILALFAAFSYRTYRGRLRPETFSTIDETDKSVSVESISRLVPYLALVLVVSLVFAMGGYIPAFPFVFRNVPGFGLFQAPARFLYLYSFAIVLLAGAGMTFIQGRERNGLLSKGGLLVTIGLGICLGLKGAGMYLGEMLSTRPTFVDSLGDFGLLLTLSGVVLLAKRKFEPAVWAVIVMLFVIFDLFLANTGLNPSADASLYSAAPLSIAKLDNARQDYRVFTPEKESVSRFYQAHSSRDFGDSSLEALLAIREKLLPDMGISYGILEANNYDPLQLKNSHDLKIEIDRVGPEPRLMNLFSARYLMSDIPPASGGLEQVYDKRTDIWVNAGSPPRAYIVHAASVAASHEDALAKVMDPRFDVKAEVVLEREPSMRFATLSSSIPADGDRVTILESSGDKVLIEYNQKEPGILVLTDAYYPGWRATVDGQEKEIALANYAFRAVELTSGHHFVEFRYEPVSFKVGLIITSISLFLSVSLLVAGMYQWLGERRRNVYRTN